MDSFYSETTVLRTENHDGERRWVLVGCGLVRGWVCDASRRAKLHPSPRLSIFRIAFDDEEVGGLQSRGDPRRRRTTPSSLMHSPLAFPLSLTLQHSPNCRAMKVP